ncbi:MAG: peptidoglycan bridge formation protein FemAB, partial [Scardovia wiggsiae]|nr:peptidoglycan bridge formation protein FemAB [Scardovia wiggsiae]
MFTVSPVPGAQFQKIASDNGVTLPIEQTEEWARYQDTVEGRSP